MITMKGKRQITGNNQRGATVVEFAVVASLLLVILFAILEFALIFMQSHLVENAAREGVRRGVVANNYLTFDKAQETTDRGYATKQAVEAYLDFLYDGSDLTVDVERLANNNQPLLRVTVEANNFIPTLLLGMVPGYSRLDTFSYTATGFYEDPAEYDQEQN